MPSERRKRKFIDSWSQLSIAVEVVLHALLLVALIALLLFAPPFVTMFSQYTVEDHQAVARDLFALNYSKWPLFLGLALFVGVVSILFSHHIVGPSYKFRQALTRLKERNLNVDVTLRKWDYLREVQDEFSQHIEGLRKDLRNILSHQKQATELCEKLQGDDAEKLKDELKSIGDLTRSYNGVEES